MLHHQSPYFALYHKLPTYTYLKVFGSSCFPYLCPYNTHKLQYRSLEYAFLGYNSHHKGYLCLDIHSGRVYISRHVIFNEDSFPFKNLSYSLSLNLFLFTFSYQFLCPFPCLPFPHLLLILHLYLILFPLLLLPSLVLVPLSLPLPHFPFFHTLCLHLFHLIFPFLIGWTCMYLVWIHIYLLLLALTIFILW